MRRRGQLDLLQHRAKGNVEHAERQGFRQRRTRNCCHHTFITPLQYAFTVLRHEYVLGRVHSCTADTAGCLRVKPTTRARARAHTRNHNPGTSATPLRLPSPPGLCTPVDGRKRYSSSAPHGTSQPGRRSSSCDSPTPMFFPFFLALSLSVSLCLSLSLSVCLSLCLSLCVSLSLFLLSCLFPANLPASCGPADIFLQRCCGLCSIAKVFIHQLA